MVPQDILNSGHLVVCPSASLSSRRAAIPRPATVRVPPAVSQPRSHSSTTPVKSRSPFSSAVKLTASVRSFPLSGSHRQVS